MTVQVWLKSSRGGSVDDFARIRSRPGVKWLRELAARTACSAADTDVCQLARDAYGRVVCSSCGSGWSVAHTQEFMVAARASGRVGVDIETYKRRSAALRWLERHSGVQIGDLEQWTQAEALWKAMGFAHRRPSCGELPLLGRWHYGWQVSRDHQWRVYTEAQALFFWSVAVERAVTSEIVVESGGYSAGKRSTETTCSPAT